MIPIVGIVIDSPIGKALARRLEGPEPGAARRSPSWPSKVELLRGRGRRPAARASQGLQEENQFLQRLLEDQPRPALAAAPQGAVPRPARHVAAPRPPRPLRTRCWWPRASSSAGSSASSGSGCSRTTWASATARRLHRRVPDPQSPAEPVRRRRAVRLVHPGLRPAAGRRAGRGGRTGGRRGVRRCWRWSRRRWSWSASCWRHR